MAKKLSKSKAVKPLVKKYQSAGYNMSGIDPTMRSNYLGKDEASMAERQYKALYGRVQQFENQASESEKQIQDERKQFNKQLEQDAKNTERQFLSNATVNLAQEGTAALAKQAAEKQLVDKAAKKAFEKASKKAVKEAGQAAVAEGATGMSAAAAQQAATQVGGVGGVGFNALAASKNVAEAAKAAAAPTKLLGSNMSGLASAGIGLGLTGAGMLVNKKTNDNDYTTFSDKEKKGMKWSAGLQGAGSGFSTGAMLGSAIPGVGNVVGGIVGAGIGAGVGLLKSKGDIKDAEETAQEYQTQEAQRKAELANQDAQLAAAYNAAFVKSRLSGKQTGFGLNSSTTPGMDTTGALYAKTGGSRGQIVPIGDDAVKFVGPKHRDGGIKLDKYTEVEGGETMDKVMMNGGKPNDYFFSAYLKLGGKSFAKRHEELVKSGAGQKEIQDLARKQEAVANKKGEKDRGPEQIAKYGGIHQYKTAGPEESAMAQSNMDAKNVTLRDTNKANAKAPSDQQSVAPGKRTNFSGVVTKYQTGFFKDSTKEEEEEALRTDPLTQNITSNNWAGHVKSKTPAPATGVMMIQSAVPGFEERQKAEAEAEAAKKASAGSSSKKTSSKNSSKSPSGATNATGSTANKTSSSNTPTSTKFDQNLFKPGVKSATAATDQFGKFVGFPEGKQAISKDDEGGTSMSIKGVPTGQSRGKKFFGKVTDMEYTGMVAANPWFDFSNFDPTKKDHKNADGSLGSSDVYKFQQEYNKRVKAGEKLQEDGKLGQQTATSRLYKDTPAETPIAETTPETPPAGETPPKEEEKKKEEQAKIEMKKKGVSGSLVAGLAQLIPVGYSLARPYKEAKGIESQFIGSTGVRGAILPRVNMNAERAAAISNTVAIRKMAESQSGPGSMIAAIAAGGQQGDQMLRIANQEQEANKQLAAEEARLGQQASQFNASQAMQAQTATADNRSRTDMFNKQLEVSEKQYKREGTLNALDAAAARIAGVVKDERSYKAQERLAKALDATGSYDRFTVYEQLQKEAQNADSPYHGMTDIQLKKIASDVYNQQWGEQGGEGDKAQTGGRRYTSRLGQLSRNRKSFNI